VKDIGQELQLPVVDIFTALQQLPDWTTAALLPDGLHLNPEGNRVVHDLVLAAIQTHYPAL
jgi:lysophospholipase L1-like esterase